MRKWTEAQERTIIEMVQKYPDHLHTAFREASEITGRTPESCKTRYYNVITKREEQNAEQQIHEPVNT